MNLFFISYGIWEHDGRMRELVGVCQLLGSTQYVTRVTSDFSQQDKDHHYITNNSFLTPFVFIFKSLFIALRMEKIDVLFVDNRMAVMPAILIKRLKRPTFLVQDVRELYLLNETKHIKGKIGCIFEQYLMRQADVVISANHHRADIMKSSFHLDEKPIVFENIRDLKYTGMMSKKEIIDKYEAFFKKNTMRIISTSGCSIERTNDVLVEAMVNLGEGYELFLVGSGSKGEIHTIKQIIEAHELNNVHIIGKLNQDELKYFVENCHIGVVNYHQHDTNNKYCASGKIYEFLFQGLPVVTTENIPLMELCDKFGIGLYDNTYVEAIRTVAKDYDFFKKNVQDFIQEFNVDENKENLVYRLGEHFRRQGRVN